MARNSSSSEPVKAFFPTCHTLTIFLEDLNCNFLPVRREVALHLRLHDRLQATNA